MLRRPRLLLVVVITFGMLGASVASAQACDSWAKPVSGAWNTASNWTGGVPGNNDSVCITLPGTYTVTLSPSGGPAGDNIFSLTVGATGNTGTQTLDIEGQGTDSNGEDIVAVALNLNAASTIYPSGALTLDSTNSNSYTFSGDEAVPGAYAWITSSYDSTTQTTGWIENYGTINSQAEFQHNPQTQIQASVTNETGGQIDVSSGTLQMFGPSSGNEQGATVNVDPGAELQTVPQNFAGASTFTNYGTIANSGTVDVNASGGNDTWQQEGGSITGNPVIIDQGSQLVDAAGPASFTMPANAGLSGTIPSGQTVEVHGSGGNTSTLSLPSSGTVTNDGTLLLDAPGTGTSSGGPSQLGNGSGELDNYGTVKFTSEDSSYTNSVRTNFINESGGQLTVGSGTVQMYGPTTNNDSGATVTVDQGAELQTLPVNTFGSSTVTNSGTIANSGTVDVSASGGNDTWQQDGGSITGNPIIIDQNSQLTDAAGPGSFTMPANAGLSGTIPSGQTVEIQGSGGNTSTLALPNTPVTNRGTLIFDASATSSGGPTQLGYGSGELDNYGTVKFTSEDTAYTNSVRTNLVNELGGQITVGSGEVQMFIGTSTNDSGATITVDQGAELQTLPPVTFGDASFTNLGTVANSGIVDVSSSGGGNTWQQEGGAISGSPITIDSGTELIDTGGTGPFDFSGNGGNQLHGTIPAGQTIYVQANNETLYLFPSSGTGFDNSGTIKLTDSDGNGGAGNATLAVANYGMFTNDGTIISSQGAFGDGSASGTIQDSLTNDSGATIEAQDNLNEASGEMTNAGALDVTAGATFSANDQLSQSAGDTQLGSGAMLDVPGGMTLTGGTLGGSGTVIGNVTNGGTVTPSTSPATLSISGNYTQEPSGTLTAELLSTGLDELSVGGAAALGGSFQVSTASGYAPTVGQAYKPLLAASVSGTFDTVTGLASGPYSLAYDPGDVALTALTPPVVVVVPSTLPSISVGNVTVSAPSGGPATATFTISLSSASSSAVTVAYNTTSGTAVSGTDFLPASGTVTFAPGQTSATVKVTVEPNGTVGSDKDFFLDLSDASGASILESRGTVTIQLGATLSSITPATGGTGGTVDFTLSGKGLAGATGVQLTRSGQANISATDVASTADGLAVTGSFDLTGAAAGEWSVVVQRADGKTVTLPGAFAVEVAALPDVSVSVSGLHTVRPDGVWNGLLRYTNSGNVNGYGTVVEISGLPAGVQVSAPGAEGVTESLDGDVGQVTFMIPEAAANSSGAQPFSFQFPNWHAHSWIDLGAIVEDNGSTAPLAPEPTLTLSQGVSNASDVSGTVTLNDGSNSGTMTFESRIGELSNSTPADGSATSTITADGSELDTLELPFTGTLCSTSGAEAQHMPWSCAAAPSPGDPGFSDPDAGILELGQAGPRDLVPAVLPRRATSEGHAASGSSVKVNVNGEEMTANSSEDALKILHELYDIHEGLEQSQVRTAQLACLKAKGYISQKQFDDLSSDAIIGFAAKFYGALVGHLFSEPAGLLVGAIPDPYDKELAFALYANDAGGLGSGGSLASLAAVGITSHGLSAASDDNWTGLLQPDPVMTALKVAAICPPTKKQTLAPQFPVEVQTAGDPNDIQGPAGAGRKQYVRAGQQMPYTVTFQNEPTADVPAQTVVVTDHLNASVYKLGTFALGPITIADKVATPPAGAQSWHTEIDMRPTVDVIASVDASLDPATGVATWRFTSLDPTTGQPVTDPRLGFLLQDRQPPEGEGSVGFTVSTSAGLKTRLQVADSASIVFDTNAAIATPTWTNTVDTTHPKSRIRAVGSAVLMVRTTTTTAKTRKRRAKQKAEQKPAIALGWAASDRASGIATFELFASVNGHKPELLGVVQGSRRSELVECVPGRSYRFKLLAISKVGLTQAAPKLSPVVQCRKV